ncbi:hypothetical protein KIN20_001438 [Parelaphostrongylus tenuis]|uniref:SCP domain-containing protein n=1 Tax=Parelaphostrongylus tenuis TaxID=148309 RepID=A0AAD5LTN3_PARTN|nr:hypothetical protein KIN20_001438 [Parelaphostrongylus tenuis]
MAMRIITGYLLVVLGFSLSHSQGIYYPELPCSSNNLFYDLVRLKALQTHNILRTQLANGKQRNGLTTEFFPMASNMSLLKYDCELEKIARNISKLCLKDSAHDFEHVGSNNAIFELEYDSISPEIDVSESVNYLVKRWWYAGEINAPLKNLTPTSKDTLLIPFLQMANAATTSLGCAFTVCKNGGVRPFVSFVCQYGEPHVSVNVPIYKEGAPCSYCNNKCVFGSLCKYTSF